MKRNITSRLMFAGILMVALSAAAPAWPQTLPAPPDLTVCDDITCQTLFDSICSAAGFKITLTDYFIDIGEGDVATFEYEICSPLPGVCSGDNSTSCLDNEDCTEGGSPPGGICTRDCAVNTFHGISHFDVTFPEPGNSPCLDLDIYVEGDCECKEGSSVGCSVNPDAIIGDGSCFTESYPVAKCEINELQPGDCIIMTVRIAGDIRYLVLGPAVVVDKAGDNCTASCIVGPACEPCQEAPPNGEACLTRTHGFWANHPHLIQSDDPRSLNLLPITVCSQELTETQANTCGTSEALCSNAKDKKDNPAYLSLVAQLTAAWLNWNATYVLLGGTCDNWDYGGNSIQEWINYCEGKCSANKQDIGRSGCIEALTAFNESQDTGFEETPFPFDRPGPANPRQCQEARGNGINIGNCNP